MLTHIMHGPLPIGAEQEADRAAQRDGPRAERTVGAAEDDEPPVPRPAALRLHHPAKDILRAGLRERRRGEAKKGGRGMDKRDRCSEVIRRWRG